MTESENPLEESETSESIESAPSRSLPAISIPNLSRNNRFLERLGLGSTFTVPELMGMVRNLRPVPQGESQVPAERVELEEVNAEEVVKLL